ncbi:hypothetical protein Pedsa_2376 [Pseudopedobacter saltans DSM 12145]|uniref:Alanyl-tRNA synthetase n=1 Tax=Pseudopedobacter saltans (strain ATCC 51119 / DSM 12145 / JCM 21818 / CCUG 39354 / LMG 10337 / NBRC 100064 / NCIMB 13643) TaxID=762903 RepID=F0SDZ8_PSESL|nr:hypothetical protein Pedsa_2376 [Pseudopedobacter saltans DSM 12145]
MSENLNGGGKSKLVTWLKRIGLIGFLFFLIKGLIWLAILYFIGTNI